MERLDLLVRTAASEAPLAERHQAFGEVVARFQDLAYGCAYSVLGDAHLAEDAAQEAFLAAWKELRRLREPEAFAGWFRRIVLTQCNRMTRRSRLPETSLEHAEGLPSPHGDPEAAAERRDLRDAVRAALGDLSPNERMVTSLFYLNEFSQKEIAAFLEVPVTTVQKR